MNILITGGTGYIGSGLGLKCLENGHSVQKTVPRIHQGNARYQLARSMWKQMPLQVTKWFGPHLIKDIP